jgi:4-oxalocrotonate tautomerase
MPLIEVSLVEGHTVEEKRKLVKDITKIVCEDLNGVLPEHVWIKITDMPVQDFSVAGTLMVDRAQEAKATKTAKATKAAKTKTGGARKSAKTK